MLELDDVSGPRERDALTRTIGFARPYFLGLAISARLFSVGWTTRRGRAAIVDLCDRFGYRHDRREREQLPEICVDQLVTGSAPVTVCALDAVDGNVSDRELVVLSSLVRQSNASRIFEIGTFDGRTTRNLAANTAAHGHVWTLDLPRESAAGLIAPIDRREQVYVDKDESGARYRGTPEAERITQLYGDSGTIDLSGYYGTMDFVFVDASHAYQYVVNDALLAIKLLRAAGGVIAFHDYGRWDGVTGALNDLMRRHETFRDIVKVQGTTLAMLRLPQ